MGGEATRPHARVAAERPRAERAAPQRIPPAHADQGARRPARNRRGARVEGTATFVSSFLHGLYPPTREPGKLSESELRRTGRLAVIEPRETVPVTLAWRLEEGEPGPVRVDYGEGSLPLPR